MNTAVALVIVTALSLLISAEQAGQITPTEAAGYSEMAVRRYAASECRHGISALTVESMRLEPYFDLGMTYFFTYRVEFVDGQRLMVSVDTPAQRYRNATNSSDINGNILDCDRR